MLNTVRVTILKTPQGGSDYLQLISDDSISLNVVVVAGRIEVNDSRSVPKKKVGR
jgi:hypothetical protein